VGYGLTPRLSPSPGVLDLYDSEKIVKGVQGERYLIRKRQEIIIIIEDLDGHRKVLFERVTRNSLSSDTNFHTLVPILQRAVSLGHMRPNGTHTMFPIMMNGSTVLEGILEGWRKRGPKPDTYLYISSKGRLSDFQRVPSILWFLALWSSIVAISLSGFNGTTGRIKPAM
jgi:hypothetical protein